MVDSFFSNPKKRSKAPKRDERRGKKAAAGKPQRPSVADEDVTSESENEEEQFFENPDTANSSEDEEETQADKRRRLANQYLENLKDEMGEVGFDAADLDRENLSRRLEEDVAEDKGLIYRFLDAKASSFSRVHKSRFRPTAVACRYPYAYTVGRDVELVKWDISDVTKPRVLKVVYGNRRATKDAFNPKDDYKGHIDDILCVAVSPDGKYVATGSKDKTICVWAAESLSCLHVFHTRDRRGVVMGLAFRRNTNQLYAACADLKVRTFSLDQMSQVETLFGHQDVVADISALAGERCLTVGSRDRTAVVWKIADESRLTFRGGDVKEFPEGSIDCCSMIDSHYFVTGSDNGSICLWSLSKKKPVFIERQAHGIDQRPETDLPHTGEAAADRVPLPAQSPRYITAIHAIPYSDIFLTGSWSGEIKVWKLGPEMRSFKLIATLPNVKGVVDSIDVSEHGTRGKEVFAVVAAVSKQLRLGRFLDVGGRNGLYTGELVL